MAGKDFLKATQNSKPSFSLLRALKEIDFQEKALVIGCGAFSDSIFLVKKGFTVDAVDKSVNVINYYTPMKGLKFHNIPIENFKLNLNEYDIVNAQYSLPFVSPEIFKNLLKTVLKSIKPGGIYVGQFFGVNDEWSLNKKMTFLTSNEVRSFFEAFEIIKIEETSHIGKTAVGNKKFWHVIEVIAKKNK